VPAASSASNAAVMTGKVSKSCTFAGKYLAGKVQIVTTTFGRPTDRIPTFKVQSVTSFPDIKVKTVSAFPDSCGKWKFVSSFPDFKIRFVNSFPDFKMKFVTSFPGVG
jgi:hypothetical protein